MIVADYTHRLGDSVSYLSAKFGLRSANSSEISVMRRSP